MAEQEQTFNTIKLDANQAIKSFENLGKAMDYYSRMGERVQSVTQKLDQRGAAIGVTLNTLSNSGDKIGRTLKIIDDKVNIVSQSLTKASIKLSENQKAWQLYQKAIAQGKGQLTRAQINDPAWIEHSMRKLREYWLFKEEFDRANKAASERRIQVEKDEAARRVRILEAQQRLYQSLSNAARTSGGSVSLSQLTTSDQRIARLREAEEEARREGVLKKQQEFYAQLRQSQDSYLKYQKDFANANAAIDRRRQADEEARREQVLQGQKDLYQQLKAMQDSYLRFQADFDRANRAADQRRATAEANETARRTRILEQQQKLFANLTAGVRTSTKGITLNSLLTSDQRIQRANEAAEEKRRQKVLDDQQKYYDKLKNARTPTQEFARAHRQMRESVEQDNVRLFIGWDALVRFLQFRLVYGIGFMLVGAIKNASQEIRQFEIRVSEIRTISQENQLSFARWTDEIYRLSDAFGLPTLDVAKATYDAVSNQIGQGAKATRFLNSALKFAITTVSSATDAQNLLSSAINSYNYSIYDAERLSAVFFRTIDKGRVTASEMANSIGRILPTAHGLGISFEEVNASIATLTIRGIKWSEAFTLINNVMLKLTKPSEDMQALLKSWGVETGPAAIAAFGFAGVLRKLRDETRGSTAEMAQLFKEMRAFRGGVSLTQGLDDFEKTLDSMTTDVLPAYNLAFVTAMESSGRTVEIELNKIKNFLSKDWGKPLVDALAGRETKGLIATSISQIIQVFGGLTETLKAAITGFRRLAIMFVAYQVYTRTATTVTIAHGRALMLNDYIARRAAIGQTMYADKLGLITRRTMAASAAMKLYHGALSLFKSGTFWFVGITFALDLLISKYQDVKEKQRRIGEDAVADYEKQQEEMGKLLEAYSVIRLKIVQNALDREFRARHQAIASLRAATTAALDLQKEDVQAQGKILKEIIDIYVKDLESSLTRLEQRVRRSGDLARSIRDQIANLGESQVEAGERMGLQGMSPEDELRQRLKLAEMYRQTGQTLLQQAANVGDPAEAERLVSEGTKRYQKAYDYINSVLERQNEVAEKIKQIQGSLAELDAKGVGRDAIAGMLDQQRKLQQLEKNAAEMAKKKPFNNPSLTSAQRAVADQQDVIRRAREALRDNTDASNRVELEQQLAALQSQVSVIAGIGDGVAQVNNLYNQQKALLEAIANQQERQAVNEAQRLENEKRRVGLLQGVLGQLAAFKLPDKIDKPEDIAKGLQQYDELIRQASSLGLTDQGVLLELEKYRVKIARQADLEIKTNRLASLDETLAQEKAKLQDMQKRLTEGKGKTKDEVSAAIKALINQSFPITQANLGNRFFQSQAGEYGGNPEEEARRAAARGSIDAANQTIESALRRLVLLMEGRDAVALRQQQLKNLGAPKTDIDRQTQAQLQRDIAERLATLGGFTPQGELDKMSKAFDVLTRTLTDVAGKSPSGVDTGGVSMEARLAEIGKFLLMARGAFKDQTIVQQQEVAYEQLLRQHNINLTAVNKLVQEQTSIMKEFGIEFATQLREASIRLSELKTRIAETSIQLQGLIQSRPPNQPAPVPRSPDVGPVSRGTSVGDIIINYNSQGAGTAVDARQLAAQIRQEIRTGAVAPLA